MAPNEVQDAIKEYLEDRPGNGGHSDKAGGNAYELLEWAERELRAEETKFSKAKEALQIAKDVLDYCPGDKWERECTSDDRDKFQKLFDEIFK